MNLASMSNLSHIDDINTVKPKEVKYVLRNPKFDFIANNNYPTIFGSIGVMTDNKKRHPIIEYIKYRLF